VTSTEYKRDVVQVKMSFQNPHLKNNFVIFLCEHNISSGILWQRLRTICFHKKREMSAVDDRILGSEEGFLQWN